MSLPISFKVLNAKRVVDQLNKISDNFATAGEFAMLRACLLVVAHVVKTKLSGQVLKRRSGDLAGSIAPEVITKKSEVIGRVGSNLKYARIHELGGVIKPVRAEYLCFVINGEFVMTKEVHIPPRPYLKPGVEELKPRLAKYLGENFMVAMKNIIYRG